MLFNKFIIINTVFLFGPAFFSCSTGKKIILLPSGLSYMDNKIGTGKQAEAGNVVIIHFKGWFIKDPSGFFKPESDDTAKIELGNTCLKNKPLEFILGENNFIKGSDEGIAGMKEGGIRTIIIPSELMYGSIKDKSLPSNSRVKLVVEVLHLK